jgi:hypothetical protein
MLRPAQADLGEEAVALVRRWFDLLAEGRFDDACAMLDEPNCYGIRWTPEKIVSVVEHTFRPGSRFRVDHPGPRFSRVSETAGDPRPEVLPLHDGSGFLVDHDVPLNGRWSDLTAQFEFLARGDAFAIVLHDLHVL